MSIRVCESMVMHNITRENTTTNKLVQADDIIGAKEGSRNVDKIKHLPQIMNW